MSTTLTRIRENRQPGRHDRLNCVRIAEVLGCGVYIVRAVKKANRLLAKQGRERAIFSGWYSTPAKVDRWLDDHPGFVARDILKRNQLDGVSLQTESPHALPAHQPA